MAKKLGRKSLESLKKRARSSVGRAPQWHAAEPQKNPSKTQTLEFPPDAEVIEIPSGWEPVPAMRYVDGRPFLYRVLIRISPERLESDLKTKRRTRSA